MFIEIHFLGFPVYLNPNEPKFTEIRQKKANNNNNKKPHKLLNV